MSNLNNDFDPNRGIDRTDLDVQGALQIGEAMRRDPNFINGGMPRSSYDPTLIDSNPAVQRAVNTDDTAQAEALYSRCLQEIGMMTVANTPGLAPIVRRAIFDAVALGKQIGKLEAEKIHSALGQRQLEARLAVLMPTCVAVTMDAACMTELFVANETIADIWTKYELNSTTEEAGIRYHLKEKSNG